MLRRVLKGIQASRPPIRSIAEYRRCSYRIKPVRCQLWGTSKYSDNKQLEAGMGRKGSNGGRVRAHVRPWESPSPTTHQKFPLPATGLYTGPDSPNERYYYYPRMKRRLYNSQRSAPSHVEHGTAVHSGLLWPQCGVMKLRPLCYIYTRLLWGSITDARHAITPAGK
jgi:hypothetical protein